MMKINKIGTTAILISLRGFTAPAAVSGASPEMRVTSVSPDTVFFFTDSISGMQGTQGIVQVRQRNFQDILSVQGSVSWDTAVATFDSITFYGLPDMSNANFGMTIVSGGVLTFSWNDPTLMGVTRGDSTATFGMSFHLTGNPGAQTPVTLSDSPVVWEVSDTSLQVL